VTVIGRQVEPEWLDELPADDSAARGSRRDLRRLNAWMGHAGILGRALAGQMSLHPDSVLWLVELGAGDGTLMLKLARRWAPAWKGARVTLVDRLDLVSPRVVEGIRSLGWEIEVAQADVSDWLKGSKTKGAPAGVLMCNLFLHHFDGPELGRLFRAILDSQARVFLACEPHRSRLSLWGSRCLGLAGCNRVTRHDAVASVRAGFRQRELSSLWPGREGWNLTETKAGLFSHLFVASRRET
jgi:hypothetical protein